MYDTNKQSKNGIVVSYKHIAPENKIIKIGIRKNDRELYSILFLTLAKQFKNKVIAPIDNDQNSQKLTKPMPCFYKKYPYLVQVLYFESLAKEYPWYTIG